MHNLVYLVHFLISICSATAVTWLDRRGLLNIGGVAIRARLSLPLACFWLPPPS